MEMKSVKGFMPTWEKCEVNVKHVETFGERVFKETDYELRCL